ncbi:MAG: transposase [Candidatus Hodarchaeales archaeon]
MTHTGKSSTKVWFFGYKLHLVVDVATEVSVTLIATPSNRYDGQEILSLLHQTRSNIPTDIKVVLTDKGYYTGYNYLTIVEDFNALPIIPKRVPTPQYSPHHTTLDQFLLFPPVKNSRHHHVIENHEKNTIVIFLPYLAVTHVGDN